MLNRSARHDNSQFYNLTGLTTVIIIIIIFCVITVINNTPGHFTSKRL